MNEEITKIQEEKTKKELEEKFDKELKERARRFNSLPEKIQKIFISDELVDLIEEQARLNRLDEERTGDVSRVVGDVFYAFIAPDVFVPTLMGVLEEKGVNSVVAKSIAQEIDSKIFAPIREDLAKVYHRFKIMSGVEEESKPDFKEKKKSRISIGEKPTVLGKETEAVPQTAPAFGGGMKAAEFKPLEIKPTAEENKEPISQSRIISESKIDFVVATSPPPPPLEEKKSKPSFLSFLRFKKPSEEIQSPAGQLTIIGKEQEIKPVLEEPSPWQITFADVKPSKEKVVSEIEVKPQEHEIKSMPFEKSLSESEKKIIPPAVSKLEQPPVAESLEQKLETTPFVQKEEVKKEEITTPISSSAETSFEKPAIAIPGVESKIEPTISREEKPLQTPIESPKEGIKEEARPISEEKKEEISKEDTSSNIPTENVIDLRKLKF